MLVCFIPSLYRSERSEESWFVPAQAETRIPRSARDDKSEKNGPFPNTITGNLPV